MKKLFQFLTLAFIATTLTNSLYAQSGYDDVVYLKNGSVIHGLIVEQIPNVSIKIQTKTKDIFVFKMEEIEKMAKEPKPTSQNNRSNTRVPEPFDIKTNPYTGYILTIESHLGASLNEVDNNRMTTGTHVVNGVTFKNMFSVGGGVGFDFISGNNYEYNNNNYYYDHNYLVSTYYLDLRAHPLRTRVSPMVMMDIGYSAALFTSDVTGGFLFNAGAGVKLNITKKIGLNVCLNYKMQKLNYNNVDYYNGTQYYNKSGVVTMENFCLTFGVSL